MSATANTQTVTLALSGLPAQCPHCEVPAAQVTEWLLAVHGGQVQVMCPRCFTAIAPVRAVAAPQPAAPPLLTSLDSDDYNQPEPLTDVAMVCTACRKPVERVPDDDWVSWRHVSADDGLDCSAVNWGPVKAMVAEGNEKISNEEKR